MHNLSEHQLLLALAALAAVLILSRAAGELAKRVGQPEVLGELFAGFLLGPTVFGALLPTLHGNLFLDPAVSLVLSGFSWIGAILVLLMAGMEVDLAILRKEARPGILAAASAIVPSLAAGSAFAWLVLGRTPPDGLFLGIVLSVTAVSVASKILLEREVIRRSYAQIIVAAGVASEVVVWLLVSVVSSFHSGSPVLAGVRSAAFALAFFAFMVTLGRRFTFKAMRAVQDVAWLAKGQLTVVLALTFMAAAITQALGLHALLGAFVFGVLLSKAPRSNEALREGLQSFTVALFGPIFFALAGMRVDMSQLRSASAIATVLLLLGVATAVKVGFSSLGARLGGRRGWEAVLVGVGLNLKGGTDVVVAVVGVDLGLLTGRAYTMYAVVAILTVLLSPPILAALERRAPPTELEEQRLESEEAARRAYLSRVERVLVPVGAHTPSSLAASVVERIATSKHAEGQLFDITKFEVEEDSRQQTAPVASSARDRLGLAAALQTVEVTQQSADIADALDRVVGVSAGYDLVAIGAHRPACNGALSFGPLQDTIIHRAATDVLVVVDDDAERFDCSLARRILVPTNGLEYSMAAGDIAGALAGSCDAEVVLFHVVHTDEGEGEAERERLVASASGVIGELAFRLGRLGVRGSTKVEVANSAANAILAELEDGDYQMVVLGGVDRGADDQLYLGKTILTVLARAEVPGVLLVSLR